MTEKGCSSRSKTSTDLISLTNTPVELRRYKAGQPKKIRCHVLSSTSSPFGIRSFIAAPLPPEETPGGTIGKKVVSNKLLLFDRAPSKLANLQLRRKKEAHDTGRCSVDRMMGERRMEKVLIGNVRKIRKGQDRPQSPQIRTGQLCCSESRRGRDQSTHEPWPLGRSGVPMQGSVYDQIFRNLANIQHGRSEAAYQGSR